MLNPLSPHIEVQKRKGQQRMWWFDSITDSMDTKFCRLWEIGQDLAYCSPWDCRVRHNLVTEQLLTLCISTGTMYFTPMVSGNTYMLLTSKSLLLAQMTFSHLQYHIAGSVFDILTYVFIHSHLKPLRTHLPFFLFLPPSLKLCTSFGLHVSISYTHARSLGVIFEFFSSLTSHISLITSH